jgi:hypothetical protein
MWSKIEGRRSSTSSLERRIDDKDLTTRLSDSSFPILVLSYSVLMIRARRDDAARQVPESEQLRDLASQIKEHTLSRLGDESMDLISKVWLSQPKV